MKAHEHFTDEEYKLMSSLMEKLYAALQAKGVLSLTTSEHVLIRKVLHVCSIDPEYGNNEEARKLLRRFTN